MSEQRGATGPPIAMERPAGQPTDLPKEGNTRTVELPQGMPRHDQVRERPSTPTGYQQNERPALPAPPGGKPSTVPAVSSEETGETASASSLAPRRKILAVGAGGGGIGVPLSVILAYYLPGNPPTEVAVAFSGILVAALSFLAGYLTPAE